MSALNEILPQLRPASPNQLCGKTLLPGIALSSFSALLLELALTRLFSVVLFYHFAFLAISIALLGNSRYCRCFVRAERNRYPCRAGDCSARPGLARVELGEFFPTDCDLRLL